MGQPVTGRPLRRGRRQGPCSRWMPRARARRCTLRRISFRGARRHTDVEPVRRQRRKPLRNDVQRARLSLPAGTDLQNQPCRDFTTVASDYTLRAGVIQARDGRLYGTSAAASDPLTLSYYGSVFRVEANGTHHGAPSSSTAAIARTLSQSSSRSTTAACTAQPLADPVEFTTPSMYTERSSGLTRPPGRSRRATASAGPMARSQPAG